MYSASDVSAANSTKVTGNNTVNIQSNVSSSNSISLKSDLQGSTSKTANINITNNFRDAHSPGYPNPGNTINQANYDNWAWTVINITNNGPDDTNVTIQDNGSNGFVYYNPSIGWKGYVRINNGTGWTWDNNFNVTTGLGTYYLPSGANYQIAILGYMNQTGTVTNTVQEISQDAYTSNPYPSVTTTLTVPPSAIIKLNQEFRTSLTGSPIENATYLDWVYNVITTTNNGPNSANVKYQITSTGLTPNGTYEISTDNGLTWISNDGSYNSGTGIWTINLPSKATYLIAIYEQVTQQSVQSTVNEISQDVYTPYAPDNTIAKCLIDFDDGNVAQYNIAFKYMQTKGMTGTAYVNGYLNGQPQVLTIAEMQEMEAAGWIIGNHVYDHVPLTALTVDQINTELTEQINFLTNNGLALGAYYLAYPGGYSNQTVWDVMKQLGFKTGRTTDPGPITNLNDLDLYQIPAYVVDNTTTVAEVEGYVNNALNTDSTIVLLFHNIVDSNPGSYEYSTSNFESIIDYIAASGIDCMNINDLYQQSSSPVNIPSNGIVYSNKSTSNGYSAASAALTVSSGSADVSVNNTASNYTPNNQDTIILTVTVKNNGPSTAQNVQIAESLNGNYLTYISDDSNGKYNPNTGIWTIGNLTNGSTAIIHITAKVNTSNVTIINKVTYTPVTTDPNSTNNNQTITLTVPNTTTGTADVSVNNTSSNYTPNNQDTIILTVTVKNNGPSTAQNVQIAESLNGNYLTYISDDSNGKYNPNTGIWTIGNLTNGSTAIIHITAKVNTSNVTIINKVTYTPVTTDPNSTNNNQTITLTVPNTTTGTADVSVNNTSSNYTPNNQDTIILTVTVKNNGPSTAQNVQIAESLNGNYLTYISDDSNGKYNPNTGIWTIGNLTNGSTAIIHITAKVNTSNVTIINKVTYTPVTTDPNSTNNNQTITLTVPNTTTGTADVSVNNTSSNYTPNNQDTIILTVTVKNNGPSTAQNVQIAESLNGNYLTYVSDDSNGKYNPNTGIWTIGNLTNGSTAIIHITAKVNTSNVTIINKVTYTPVTTDPNSTNNSQSITITVPKS